MVIPLLANQDMMPMLGGYLLAHIAATCPSHTDNFVIFDGTVYLWNHLSFLEMDSQRWLAEPNWNRKMY